MAGILQRVLFGVFVLLAAVAVARAQEPLAVANVTEILGLENVKRNVRGQLVVEPGALAFVASKTRAELPIASIEDVFTGDDSKRMIGGTLGTLTMFAPYGSGRFLSLFREKVDVLTVEYRDAGGGLHGAVFMVPKGKAAEVKKELIARGVHASLPVEKETKPTKEQEKKP